MALRDVRAEAFQIAALGVAAQGSLGGSLRLPERARLCVKLQRRHLRMKPRSSDLSWAGRATGLVGQGGA
jgi:hypothetical protein